MRTWDEMNGRERDAFVAEKLFGWRERPCDLEENGGELTIYSSGDASCPRCGAYAHINDFEHQMLQPAHYTADMTAAWTIAELERFSGVELVRLPGHPGRYLCEVSLPDQEACSGAMFRGVGKAAPEAICLAALRACGVSLDLLASKNVERE